jgi:hypothetical protein
MSLMMKHSYSSDKQQYNRLADRKVNRIRKILLTLSMVIFLQTAVHAADKIRIGYPDFNSSTFTLPLAQMRGFFQEEGLEAELIRVRSAVAIPALTSGEIDYHTVVSPALAAALRGIPVRLVACFTPGLTTVIIARPEFKRIQDLKGKTIGLNSIGGGLESTVRMMLKHYGIDPDKDVKFLATGTVDTRFAALKQGLTVATAGSTPVDSRKEIGIRGAGAGLRLVQLSEHGFGHERQKDQGKSRPIEARYQSRHQGEPLSASESRRHHSSHHAVDESR